MKELSKKEVKEVSGGHPAIAVAAVIASLAAGVITGYVVN